MRLRSPARSATQPRNSQTVRGTAAPSAAPAAGTPAAATVRENTLPVRCVFISSDDLAGWTGSGYPLAVLVALGIWFVLRVVTSHVAVLAWSLPDEEADA